ncbi:unnamed protein product [Periconia digitata]|uniref:Uncharacterized protein n=1 Tax=Periconia digitata TaxID=1303443 RepID=A0A9W4XSI2_9PLEO|nr:unnamed protein product [Periconia digitata]
MPHHLPPHHHLEEPWLISYSQLSHLISYNGGVLRQHLNLIQLYPVNLMAASSSTSPFLRLPSPVRQRIYIYLLAPHAKETVTTINYTLRWPWFENPSNTTFNGAVQIDLCRCPQNPSKPRTSNTKTEDHIYSRSKCYGPNVLFNPPAEHLWVCGDDYADSGQINFLRPGVKYEPGYEANVDILATCQTVYQEAVGLLYRNRNFLFLTGPCPRGRYQSYATRVFLSRLSPCARAHVTSLSIINVPYEEDANINDAQDAYRTLAVYIQLCLPSFQTLSLNLWNKQMGIAAASFGRVFEKSGIEICLRLENKKSPCIRLADEAAFGQAIRSVTETSGSSTERAKVLKRSKQLSEEPRAQPRHGTQHVSQPSTPPKLLPRWEEVEDEDIIDDLDIVKGEVLPYRGGTSTALDMQRSSSLGEDEGSDEEWYDAPVNSMAEDWEVV